MSDWTGAGTTSVAGTGTVQSIYDLLQYRRDILVNSDDLIHVVNAAIRSIAKRLYVLGSDLITSQLSVSVVYLTEDEYGVLPSDFWGMKDDPYLDGYTEPLLPLPGQTVALQYQNSGFPLYYKIKGLKIYLYPPAGADYTIKGDYFVRPTLVSGVNSVVPFNELFDDLIAEYVEIYFRGPQNKEVSTIEILGALVKNGVDSIAIRYDRKGPVNFKQCINWRY